MKSEEILLSLHSLLGDEWPEGARILRAIWRLQHGDDFALVVKEAKTSSHNLRKILSHPDPVAAVLGVSPSELSEIARAKSRQTLGNLLVGHCAELAFEAAYTSEMHTEEFQLVDQRESRSDTDYRLVNGGGRPLYRLNIKFHGSRFQKAKEMVNLDPEDCFALATYKIHNALKKQEAEQLPYIFVIVGVSGLRADGVGAQIPAELVDLTAAIHNSQLSGKRDIEDAITNRVVNLDLEVFRRTYDQIAAADWYLMSARRADNLLKEKLYERVYALRVRAFAQNYRGAEVDMHFSLANDLTPLPQFFATLKKDGQTKVASQLERGSL